MREVLLKFYNDLNVFSPEVPIVVTYDKKTHQLTYRQLNKLVMTPYIIPYYLPKRKFEVGILTADGYVNLMKNLQKLVIDTELDKQGSSLAFSIDKLSLKVYKTYHSSYLIGPQLYMVLKFVNITSKLLSKFIMRNYSTETKTLLKLINNERKYSSKSSK